MEELELKEESDGGIAVPFLRQIHLETGQQWNRVMRVEQPTE